MRVEWAVCQGLAVLPLAGRVLGNGKALGLHGSRPHARSDLAWPSWCGRGIFEEGDHHEGTLSVGCSNAINSWSTARAMDSGRFFRLCNHPAGGLCNGCCRIANGTDYEGLLASGEHEALHDAGR